jgi:hypothetical protein
MRLPEFLQRSVSAEQIQREILVTQDKVVAEAKALIASASTREKSSKAERLKALGFIASKDVAESDELKAKERAAATIKAAEEGATLQYPGFKFVSKDVMNTILKKYGLVIAGVERYKGEVPDWALSVIERSGVVKTMYESRWWCINEWVLDYSFDSHKEATDYIDRRLAAGSKQVRRVETRSNLLIAAPAREMIVLRHEEVVEGRIRVKDPIVCVEVPHGYVVVAAWGEEGQDPGVFNANVN